MEYARNYTHKTFGEIGSARFIVPEGTFTLNGATLGANGVAHLMVFALQSLQDAYAGAETAEDAVARYEAKLARILDGTIGVRGGSGMSDLMRIARRLASAAWVKKYGKDAWDALDDDAQDETVTGVMAKNAGHFEGLAQEEADRLEAARKAKAKIAEKSGGLDL